MIASASALLLLLQAGARPPDLDWLAGYWLSCDDGTEVSETWSDRRGTIMLGSSLTLLADGSSTHEQMRIAFDFSSGPDWRVFLTAQPHAQPPATFRLVRHGDREAVFENPEHDFPKRIRYWREGDRLLARIEGEDGRSAEWDFRSAPLNARCRG
jgi:hypothetical protein